MWVKIYPIRFLIYSRVIISNLEIGSARNAIILIGAAEKCARHVCLVCSSWFLALGSTDPLTIDAEGNGDSISAAIQSERIALLTSVLTHGQVSDDNVAPLQGARSYSSTPFHSRHTPESSGLLSGSFHLSQSHVELATQYTNHMQLANSGPIYQTSGHRQPSPLYTTGPEMNQGQQVHAPAPLLPSFLQDIVRSPALSPSSSSSADLSFEEDANTISNISGKNDKSDSPSRSPSGNIWRLDIDESRSLNVFALPNQHDLVGGARRASFSMHHIR